MPGDHALLSPSGASRWIACPPSARFESGFAESTSTAADEGTLAHDLAEQIIKRKLGRIAKKTYDKELGRIMSHELYSSEMTEHCTNYALFVIEKYNEALERTKDALLFQETKLDLTFAIPEGFGRLDVAIIANHQLIIIDLKYGKGVPVNAVNNSQLKIYALGAENEWGFMYDITGVEMIIHQPRLDSVTTDVWTLNDLHKWKDEVLIPAAQRATEGKGDYVAGDHCRFCRGRALCRVNKDYLTAMLHPAVDPNRLTDDEVAEIILKGDEYKNWIKTIESFALAEAIKGKKWPGFKLVSAGTKRRYTDEDQILKTLTQHGYHREAVTTTKLLGMTELKKEIGAEDFDKYVSLIKPPGAPTLASLDDKRPELPSGAALDFAGVIVE